MDNRALIYHPLRWKEIHDPFELDTLLEKKSLQRISRNRDYLERIYKG